MPDYSINVLSRRDNKTNCLLNHRKEGVQLDARACSSTELWSFNEWIDINVEDTIDFRNGKTSPTRIETVMGDQTLKMIAHELVDKVRQNTSIDWQFKQSVQARLRVLVKRILRKYKYPPDNPETGEYTESVNKVLDQAELLADFLGREAQ